MKMSQFRGYSANRREILQGLGAGFAAALAGGRLPSPDRAPHTPTSSGPRPSRR